MLLLTPLQRSATRGSDVTTPRVRDRTSTENARRRPARRAHMPPPRGLRLGSSRAELDVLLACPRFGGRMRFLATIEDPAIVRKILRHFGLVEEVLAGQPARSSPRGDYPSP